jgi:hypothetical protein
VDDSRSDLDSSVQSRLNFRFEVQRPPSRPNKSLQPTATAVTFPAGAGIAPAVAVAEH